MYVHQRQRQHGITGRPIDYIAKERGRRPSLRVWERGREGEEGRKNRLADGSTHTHTHGQGVTMLDMHAEP